MNKDKLGFLTKTFLIGSLVASGCTPVVVANEKVVPSIIPTVTPKPTELPTETEIPQVVPKIMVLGDSITEFGFGKGLEEALDREDVKGDFTIEGHGGFTTKMILESLQNGTIKVDQNVPDLLLVELGTNDVLRGKYTNQETINYIEGIILFFRDKNPNVKIALFPIIPSNYGTRSEKRIRELNFEYLVLAKLLSTTDSPIIVSDDIAPVFDKEEDLIDGLHPSTSGYQKMVDSAAGAISTLLDP